MRDSLPTLEHPSYPGGMARIFTLKSDEPVRITPPGVDRWTIPPPGTKLEDLDRWVILPAGTALAVTEPGGVRYLIPIDNIRVLSEESDWVVVDHDVEDDVYVIVYTDGTAMDFPAETGTLGDGEPDDLSGLPLLTSEEAAELRPDFAWLFNVTEGPEPDEIDRVEAEPDKQAEALSAIADRDGRLSVAYVEQLKRTPFGAQVHDLAELAELYDDDSLREAVDQHPDVKNYEWVQAEAKKGAALGLISRMLVAEAIVRPGSRQVDIARAMRINSSTLGTLSYHMAKAGFFDRTKAGARVVLGPGARCAETGLDTEKALRLIADREDRAEVWDEIVFTATHSVPRPEPVRSDEDQAIYAEALLLVAPHRKEPPYDPTYWGIDGQTAKEIDSFARPGLPRIPRARFGEIDPPSAVTDHIPDIAQFVGHQSDPGRWYWNTKPPHPEFRRREDVASPRLNAWTTEDDALFAARWTPDLDAVVDDFIEVYRSAWSLALEQAKPESNAIAALIHDLIRSGDIATEKKGSEREHLMRYKLANAFETGPFNLTVARRTWEFPTMRYCGCCGAAHYFDVVTRPLLRIFGKPGICAACMTGARYGDTNVGPFSRSQVLGSLRQFADITKMTPGSTFRDAVYAAAMSDDDRGLVVALLITIPTPAHLRSITGSSSWAKVLQAAGISGPDGQPPRRGTVCLADDGHGCRNLAEQAICNWFDSHAVKHEFEPLWPQHPELNPSGELRATWAIGDIFFEFAGLMGEAQYENKIGLKSRLARASGITLVVLQPEDLPRLDSILGKRFGTSGQ